MKIKISFGHVTRVGLLENAPEMGKGQDTDRSDRFRNSAPGNIAPPQSVLAATGSIGCMHVGFMLTFGRAERFICRVWLAKSQL